MSRFRSTWDASEEEQPAPLAQNVGTPALNADVLEQPTPKRRGGRPRGIDAKKWPPPPPGTLAALFEEERTLRELSRSDFAKFLGISLPGYRRFLLSGSMRFDTFFYCGEVLGWTLTIQDIRGGEHKVLPNPTTKEP